MLPNLKKYLCIVSFFILTLSVQSCTHKPELGNFDLAKWKGDRGGCKNERTTQIAEIKKLRQQLKGISSNDMLDMFGKPDIQRLTERNQEYFVYFLEKGTHCGTLRPVSDSKSMIVRFSAMKLATEITFQNGTL